MGINNVVKNLEVYYVAFFIDFRGRIVRCDIFIVRLFIEFNNVIVVIK